MNNDNGKGILIVRIIAIVFGCLVMAWIGWAIYQAAVHPAGSSFGTTIDGIVTNTTSVPPAGMGVVTPQQTTQVGGNFSPVQCGGFAGFSADAENTALATQYNRARYLSSVPGLVLFGLEYFCASTATGTVEQKYTFYDNAGHTMYELDNTALDGGNGAAVLEHDTYPGNGCGGSLQWNIPSSQAIAQFMSNGGSAALANAAASGTPVSLDAKLFCMPPGVPEWTISLSAILPNGLPNFLRSETYNAVNGASVMN